MLLGQHRRRHENRRLAVIHYALHDRPERDLGLAVAHVAAQQAVHGRGGLHIGLYLVYAAELIVGLGVAEVILKLALPGRIGRKSVAGRPRSLGVERDELLCQLLCRGLGAAARFRPLRAAHLRQLYLAVLSAAEIFRHHVKLRRGHIQCVRSGVADLYIVLLEAVHLHLVDAREAADAVDLMNDIVARRQVGI